MNLKTKHIHPSPFGNREFQWSTSILTKMTGVVLWTLMLIMFLLAVIFNHIQSDILKAQLISTGEAKIHQILERYIETRYYEKSLNNLLQIELSRIPDNESASTIEKHIHSLQEQNRVRLERHLLQERTEGNLEGMGLLTQNGRYYASGGEPDVIDFLKKRCQAILTQGMPQSGTIVQEHNHLYTLTTPVRNDSNTPDAVIAVALSKDTLTHKIAAMRKEVFLIITMITILLSFPIIYFLQKWVIQPIRDVSQASKEISDGNFSKRIPVHSQDEIGILAKNFNKMTTSLNFRDERLSLSYGKIQELKDYYDSIISNAPVGILTLDQHGNVGYENPTLSEIFYPLQIRRGKSKEKRLQDIQVLQDTPINDVYRRIMSGEIVEEEGFVITNHAGEKKMFSLKGVPLLNEHHFIQGSLFIFVDISQRTELESRLKETNVILEKTVKERTQEILETNEKLTQTIDDLYRTNQELVQTSEALKESNQQIAEANQMKTSFLASMSHELRTPLNAIIGFSDLILSGIDGPINEKQQEDLQSISRSGRNLLHLISDILDLSKIEAGKMQFKRKVIDINSLLTDIQPIVKNLIGEKQIEFHTLLGEEIRFFYADENKIHQILLNLISNAVKFTEKGAITLSVERQAPAHEDAEEYLRFTVTDTGIGVRDQDIQTIFDEFKQINQSSRNEDGSGLGLSITKKLVELGGGKIWVDQYYREGSRFHFTVPTTSQNITTVGAI